jgi:hypothetical protein
MAPPDCSKEAEADDHEPHVAADDAGPHATASPPRTPQQTAPRRCRLALPHNASTGSSSGGSLVQDDVTPPLSASVFAGKTILILVSLLLRAGLLRSRHASCAPASPPPPHAHTPHHQSGGTRGDVQPATALGVALLGAGAQRVRLACDVSFQHVVKAAGLEWFPLGGDAKVVQACVSPCNHHQPEEQGPATSPTSKA